MYYIIVNPVSRSGRGREYWKKIQPVLEEKQVPYQVRFSKREGHTQEMVEDLCRKHEGEELHVVVLGGDGTVNEAVQGIRDFSRFTLSYIPTGSSNDLARDLEISRNPIEALEGILEGRHDCRMDLGLLHYEQAFLEGKEVARPDRRFVVGCGIGFDAAVCEEAARSLIKDALNRLGLGKLTYVGIALKQLLRTAFVTAKIWIDDEPLGEFPGVVLIAVMVHRYEGGGFMFCPTASAQDGLLDLCMAYGVSKLRILRILPTAYKGKHLRFEGVRCGRGRQLRIETDIPLWVQTDGEAKAMARAITLTSMEEQLRIIY